MLKADAHALQYKDTAVHACSEWTAASGRSTPALRVGAVMQNHHAYKFAICLRTALHAAKPAYRVAGTSYRCNYSTMSSCCASAAHCTHSHPSLKQVACLFSK
jgi:hypothetical protein